MFAVAILTWRRTGPIGSVAGDGWESWQLSLVPVVSFSSAHPVACLCLPLRLADSPVVAACSSEILVARVVFPILIDWFSATRYPLVSLSRNTRIRLSLTINR